MCYRFFLYTLFLWGSRAIAIAVDSSSTRFGFGETVLALSLGSVKVVSPDDRSPSFRLFRGQPEDMLPDVITLIGMTSIGFNREPGLARRRRSRRPEASTVAFFFSQMRRAFYCYLSTRAREVICAFAEVGDLRQRPRQPRVGQMTNSPAASCSYPNLGGGDPQLISHPPPPKSDVALDGRSRKQSTYTKEIRGHDDASQTCRLVTNVSFTPVRSSRASL